MDHLLPAEFTIDGHKYQSVKLGAFDQFTVANTLGGVLALMFDPGNRKDKRKPPEELDSGDFARAFTLLSAGLPKDQMDLVFQICLSKVSRNVGGDQGWAAVMTEQAGVLAFQDIQLSQLLEIIWQVLKQHRIPDFFAAPLSKSRGETKDQRSR